MAIETVALFATCLVNSIRPGIAMHAARLLEDAGYRVAVPMDQTCCGQPSFNGGDQTGAMQAARHTIDVLAGFRYVIVPSGSCAGMLVKHYPDLLANDIEYRQQAIDLASRVHELSWFLVEIAGYQPKPALARTVTYHDACAGLRELGIKQQPRDLLARAGFELIEMEDAEVCCGFGGTFCIKYPDISNAMVSRKGNHARSAEAAMVATGDLGCLMNIEGKLQRQDGELPVYHIAELLAEGLE